jgi:hypothetical protein
VVQHLLSKWCKALSSTSPTHQYQKEREKGRERGRGGRRQRGKEREKKQILFSERYRLLVLDSKYNSENSFHIRSTQPQKVNYSSDAEMGPLHNSTAPMYATGEGHWVTFTVPYSMEVHSRRFFLFISVLPQNSTFLICHIARWDGGEQCQHPFPTYLIVYYGNNHRRRRIG